MDSRIEKEKEWHNERFDSNIRDHLDKYYSINTKLVDFLRDKIFSDCSGQKILEYGCGLGSHAFELALSGAIVHGIDISDVAIQKAHEIAVSKGIAGNVNFQVMNAEELSFDNNYFDKVCGSAILHHLDLNKAMPELARVLKKDGKAIFGEPLGHNPFINLYRKLTPQVRTEDEHPLLKDDLKLFSKYFKSVDIKYFHLTNLASIPFRNFPFFNTLVNGFDRLDQALFKIDFFKYQAWQVVIELSQPIKN